MSDDAPQPGDQPSDQHQPGDLPSDPPAPAPADPAETPSASESSAPPSPPPQAGKKPLLQIGLILGTVGLVLAIVLSLPRKVDLIVDNNTRYRLLIEINGQDYGDVKPGETRRCERLGEGPVTLRATELGPEDEKGKQFELKGELEVPFLAARRHAYVWNVEGMTTRYWILTKGYGDQQGKVVAPEPFEPAKDLFTIPEGLVPRLNSFPGQIRVRGKGGVRKALYTAQFVRKATTKVSAPGVPTDVSQDPRLRPKQAPKVPKQR